MWRRKELERAQSQPKTHRLRRWPYTSKGARHPFSSLLGISRRLFLRVHNDDLSLVSMCQDPADERVSVLLTGNGQLSYLPLVCFTTVDPACLKPLVRLLLWSISHVPLTTAHIPDLDAFQLTRSLPFEYFDSSHTA